MYDYRESTVISQGQYQNGSNSHMGRSFISTAMAGDSMANGNDLRKSRIQNLPNYKKNNLGDNISFIVVFQTIQIQRLSGQIQLLRVRFKEAERQLFNAQNYEIQIRELTEKCFNQQSQRDMYRIEIEKLNKVCQTLYDKNERLEEKLNQMDFSLKQKYQSEKQKNIQLTQEIEKWKNRSQATEKSKIRELEDLRNLMECQRKSVIDRQIRQMTIRFQNERANLENQIRKCREMVNNRNNEIEDFKQKCQSYEISVMELKNYKNMIEDNQNKIVLLNQELLRINEILRLKEEELQQYKKNEYNLNLKLKENSNLEYSNKQLKSLLQTRNKEIQEWRVRTARLQDEAARGKEMVHYNREVTEKLELAAKELDRLNSVLKNKLDQIEKWKQRLSEKDVELSRYRNLQNDVAQYESKISMIRTENDRTNGILKSKLEEIENWKHRANELESSMTRFGMMEKEKRSLQDKCNQYIQLNEEFKSKLNRGQNEINNMRRFEGKCKELEDQVDSLNRQIQRLNQIIRSNQQETNDYRTRYSKLETQIKEFKNINTKMRQSEDKIVLLIQEIERLNTLIKNKNSNIEQLEKEQLQTHSKLAHYKNYELKLKDNDDVISKLKNTIEISKRDTENWQNKFRTHDARMHELQNAVFSHTQEKQKLSSIVKNKTNEYEKLRSMYQQMESQMREIGNLQMVCKQQDDRIVRCMTDMEAMQRRNKQCEEMLRNQSCLLNQMAAKVIITSAEIERVHKQGAGSAQQSQLVKNLQEQFSSVVSRSRIKDSEIDRLQHQVGDLDSRCSNLMKEYQRLLAFAEKNQAQTMGLLHKIEQYQDYAKRIHILGAEMDRLMSINKGLQEDNKTMRLKYANSMNLEKREEDFNLLTILLGVEIQALRMRLQQRETTMQQMRKSILDPVRRI